MYTNTHLVFGFHGCDELLANQIINNSIKEIGKSNNKYDWLGSGIYFWENIFNLGLCSYQGFRNKT